MELSAPTQKSETTTAMSFKKTWDSLVTPHALLTGIDRQKARILSAMLVVFIPLACLTVFGNAAFTLLTGAPTASVSMGAVFAVVVVIVAYLVSRTQYYKLSALLIIAVPYIAVFAVTYTSATRSSSVISLFFLSLGIILASLLFSARETVALGVITIIVTAVLAQVAPPNPPITSSIPILGFMATCTGVTALVSNFRDRYLMQLEGAQDQLKQQIVVIDQARAQAERSDNVKSAFLASMSHELRTPLNSIINFSKFLERGIMGEVTEQQQETLREIIDNSEHLLSLINDILDMSKIESGSLKLFIEENVDLKEILNTTVSTARSLLGEKPVELKVNIDENLPKLTADRQRILQIMLNIISNACKFTAKGEIEIKAQLKNNEVHLAVRDTGPGISDEDRDEVFAAFKQTKSGLRQGGGTGLGMPISKNLAEAHNGKLWFESAANQGTTFYVTLPVKSLAPTL